MDELFLWLEYQRRILAESRRPTREPIDRLRFIGYVANHVGEYRGRHPHSPAFHELARDVRFCIDSLIAPLTSVGLPPLPIDISKNPDFFAVADWVDGCLEVAGRERRPDWARVEHSDFSDDGSVFDVLRRKPILLIHPYHSYKRTVLSWIQRVSIDPDVVSIQMTIYRTSETVIDALCRAARRGAAVEVVIETRARGDQDKNRLWLARLAAAGAAVRPGPAEFKTHAKLCLISRRESGRIRTYAHLTTGNYHTRTSKSYIDAGLMTADENLVEWARAVFHHLMADMPMRASGGAAAVAPFDLRARIELLIERETEHAAAGHAARIIAKMNTLTDARLIEKLRTATALGVKVDLIVRGVCLAPPDLNLRVRSIVDTLLEHTRILYVENGGRGELYLSSADWTERNLDRRIELMFPVADADAHRDLQQILSFNLADNLHAWTMTASGAYIPPVRAPSDAPLRSQVLTGEYLRNPERFEEHTQAG